MTGDFIECDVKWLRGTRTAQEAADLAGVSRRRWQRWEKRGRIPASTARAFAKMRGS